MIPCPSCQQSVEILDKHLGTLFTCPHCNAVYFIDWSGQPELAQHETSPPIQDYSVNSELAVPSYSTEDNFEESLPEANAFTEDESHGDVPVVQDVPYDFNQTLDAVSVTPGTQDTSDFSDVTSFANDNSAEGPLTYTVMVEGIESSHLLLQLKEAMTDSRFGWDVAELLTQVGAGRLVFKNLSPAKASVLINRIKYLPFKISWRQDALSNF